MIDLDRLRYEMDRLVAIDGPNQYPNLLAAGQERLTLPPDSLVVVKEDGVWPEWCYRGATKQFLDALAAAQPGKEI